MALTQEEKNNVKEVIVSIWGEYVARNIDINDAVVDVVGKTVTDITAASSQIYHVLVSISATLTFAPASFVKGFGYKVAANLASFMFNPTLAPAIVTAAAINRSRLEMASLGI